MQAATEPRPNFRDWQMFDGCVQAKKMDDMSLKEEFKKFGDIEKEAEKSAAEEALTDAPTSTACRFED
jgi:hypothetical protein